MDTGINTEQIKNILKEELSINYTPDWGANYIDGIDECAEKLVNFISSDFETLTIKINTMTQFDEGYTQCLKDIEDLKNKKTNLENENPALSKGDVIPRELSLHNYWDSNTSEDRVEIVERAFKMIEKQKEYIAVLNEELNGLVGMASVHGWKSNLVEQGKKLRDEMALLAKKF